MTIIVAAGRIVPNTSPCTFSTGSQKAASVTKVRSRTTPGLVYVVLPYGIVALAVYTGLHAYALHRFADAAFAAVKYCLRLCLLLSHPIRP